MHLPSIEVMGRGQKNLCLHLLKSLLLLFRSFLRLDLPYLFLHVNHAARIGNSTSVAAFLSSFSCRSRAFVASACLSFTIRLENAVLSLGFLLGLACAFHCFPVVNTSDE